MVLRVLFFLQFDMTNIYIFGYQINSDEFYKRCDEIIFRRKKGV